MTAKIFRSILLASAVVIICCALFFTWFTYDNFVGGMNETLMAEAKLVAVGVENYGRDYLVSFKEDSRITWISPEGEVLYDTSGDVSDMENHGARKEVIEAFENGEGMENRYSATMMRHSFYCSVRLSDGSVVRLSEDSDSFVPTVKRMLWVVALMLGAITLLSVLLAKILSKGIVKPINGIDIEDPDADTIYNELSPLLHKINRQNQLINTQMSDLKRRQQEFRAITENMGEGLVVVDEKGEILSYNKSALKLLGASEVPYGTSIFEVNGDEVFRETVESALGGTKRRVKIRRGDKVLRFLAGPVSTKEYGGAVIVILDITDTEEKESLRREFTSNVSHELKTPLTSIYGISEIMAEGIVKPEDMRGFAYDINKETGRLIRLVNDIIKLSQLDEGSTTLEKEQVDLMSVVKEVRERLKMVYRKNGIEFNVEGHSAVVSGVHGILSEMIYNLCDNAIKYNREGGSVTVTVDTYKGRPRVKVEDTGIGIPPEAKERVFERFYRVDKSHSKEIGGTGLGLSIVKHGAAFHSAEVKLESEYGRGTTVEIRF